jgi:predicted nucleotidyltransferase
MMRMDRDLVTLLRESARAVFEAEPVLFAYLYGSRVTGRTHRFSDVDVAVYLEESVPSESSSCGCPLPVGSRQNLGWATWRSLC